MNRKYYLAKIIVFIIVLFFALQFERAMPERQLYLVIFSSLLLLSTVLRLIIPNLKKVYLVGFIIFDTTIIFALERFSRYIVNYALHILFILLLIEVALSFERKYFKSLSIFIGLISLSKYFYMLLLVRNFSTIAESIAVSFFTIVTIISLFLYKIIQEEKEKVDYLYQEIKETHQDLAEKYQKLNLEFESDPLVSELTEREIDVCKLVASGYSNNEIAKELFISEGTVKNHITSIFRKLDMRDRTQLAIFTIKNRL